MKSTNERLDEAKCFVHQEAYDNMCINCRTRYFLNLIEDDYVPRYRLEAVEQDLRSARAQIISLKVAAR